MKKDILFANGCSFTWGGALEPWFKYVNGKPLGEIIGYDPDPFPFWHSSQTEAPGVNLASYINRKVDQLLEEARLTNDRQIREEKYLEFKKLLIDDLPAIFLYSPTYTYPVNKKVKGLQVQRITKPFDRFIGIENWYIKTKKQYFK